MNLRKHIMRKIYLYGILMILSVFCFGMTTTQNWAGMFDNNQPGFDKQSVNPAQSGNNQQPKVIYVPGLFSFDDPQKPVLKDLKSIYNTPNVENYPWYNPQNKQDEKDNPNEKADSNDKEANSNEKANSEPIWERSVWKKSVKMAETASGDLYQKIANMSEKERKNLVLVGHSLGGRIVVRVLDKLNKNNMKIRQAILLGAAMDNNDPCIPSAVQASIETVYSFVNPTDKWLMSCLADVKRAMLGTGYYDYLDPNQFCEIQIDSTERHDSSIYILSFYLCCMNKNMKQNCIIVPQEMICIPESKYYSLSLWTVVDSCQDKTLQQDWTLRTDNDKTYIIVDDLCFVRAKGTKDAMTESFAKVKKQLQNGVSDGERETTKQFTINDNSIFDNLVEPVFQKFGSSKELYWRNKHNINGWRLQNNISTKKYRILDPSSHILALGSQGEIETAFDKLKISQIIMQK